MEANLTNLSLGAEAAPLPLTESAEARVTEAAEALLRQSGRGGRGGKGGRGGRGGRAAAGAIAQPAAHATEEEHATEAGANAADEEQGTADATSGAQTDAEMGPPPLTSVSLADASFITEHVPAVQCGPPLPAPHAQPASPRAVCVQESSPPIPRKAGAAYACDACKLPSSSAHTYASHSKR